MTSVEIDWLVGVPLGEGGGGGLDSSEGKCITDGLAILNEVKKYNHSLILTKHINAYIVKPV